MGVYDYGTAGVRIPEGYLRVLMEAEDGSLVGSEILNPPNPGSIHHMTKTQDQLLIAGRESGSGRSDGGSGVGRVRLGPTGLLYVPIICAKSVRDAVEGGVDAELLARGCPGAEVPGPQLGSLGGGTV